LQENIFLLSKEDDLLYRSEKGIHYYKQQDAPEVDPFVKTKNEQEDVNLVKTHLVCERETGKIFLS
jgi:hypothetical protein